MAQFRHREETVNTQFAILLARHGVSAESETIHQSGTQRPDVMFTLGGLRVIIEGKFSDTPNADDVVLGDATRRVQTGICHIAVALVYPKTLRTVATGKLEKSLAATRLRFLVVSETGQTDWAESVPSGVLEALRRVCEALINDDVVKTSAASLSECIENIAQLWTGQAATCDRLSNLLGMPAKRGESPEERGARRETATKVASLVLANAMIFQEQLASSGGEGRVESLRACDEDPDPVKRLKSHWHWIWMQINYVPIFQLGENILNEIPISTTAISAIRWLIAEANKICANQSALRHDLMGRIYHWLLYHAKYLGTYYTATSSATLLLKLAFAQAWPGHDFGSTRKLAEFKVSDLACGTGTLLMASAQALTDQFIVSRVRDGKAITEVALRNLHQTLMENVLHGYDVLPSAVHLTASTLGMLAPNVTFRKMNLYVMPMGVSGRSRLLGSLDFIAHNVVQTQVSLDNSQLEVKRTGISDEYCIAAEVPPLDLCVMNPPFVRSVGGNLLFGSLTDDERSKLQTELKRLVKKDIPASITAGLGSVFMAIADKHLKAGGRIAFILPVALATGEAWGRNREMLAARYHVETVIVSHDAERCNFSENTDLSEIMFIARKLQRNEKPGDTTYINLWRNPTTIYEAMDVADRIKECAPVAPAGVGVPVIGAEGWKLAEIMSLPPTTGTEQWTGVQFAQALTLKAAAALGQGWLDVPGKAPVAVQLCRLGSLGTLGYDQRDIHDAFTVSKTDWSPYPAFWNHDAKIVTCIRQINNSWLSPRYVAAAGRNLKSAAPLAERAGRILLVERVRTTTHRVLAVGFDEPMLGNTWWAFKADLTSAREKALLLWLNSTPALLMMLSRRVTTEGAWMKVKKPQWEAMPVLDIRALPTETVERLAASYDRLCLRQLKALAKLNEDDARAELDAALSLHLDLPNMEKLRQLLAREPGLTGQELSPKPGEQAPFTDTTKASTQLRLI